jgi:hypothetical protein
MEYAPSVRPGTLLGNPICTVIAACAFAGKNPVSDLNDAQ